MYQLILLLLPLVSALLGSAVFAERPNIVLIIGDDQAWPDYGFMGHAEIHTPNLDALAQRSIVFERGYVASPLCRPSLATMLTGLSPSLHRITGNDVDGRNRRAELDLPLREKFHQLPSVVRSLTDAGYRTFQSGKWWEGSWQDGGFTHGMTHGDPSNGGRHGDIGLQIGRNTMQPLFRFIDDSVKEQQPFFVWYAPMMPHTPHNPPARLLQKYQAAGRADDVAAYYACCEWFDETCGSLVSHLEDCRILENTVIIFICDNGWAARSTNSRDPHQESWQQYALRSKGSPFEAGIRTPVLVSWPGRIAPSRSSDPAHASDLFPTIAAIAGMSVPENLTGINLLDEEVRGLRETISGVTHSVFNMTTDHPDRALQYRWLIHRNWKLIRRYKGLDTTQYSRLHEWDNQEFRLFDLTSDPHETTNLADENPEQLEQLSALLQEFSASE